MPGCYIHGPLHEDPALGSLLEERQDSPADREGEERSREHCVQPIAGDASTTEEEERDHGHRDHGAAVEDVGGHAPVASIMSP